MGYGNREKKIRKWGGGGSGSFLNGKKKISSGSRK
jgi:hypothetical protein